ncbi:MAG: hypothetical protein RMZ41_028830 [Nostoc sp. DedVER02]
MIDIEHLGGSEFSTYMSFYFSDILQGTGDWRLGEKSFCVQVSSSVDVLTTKACAMVFPLKLNGTFVLQ